MDAFDVCVTLCTSGPFVLPIRLDASHRRVISGAIPSVARPATLLSPRGTNLLAYSGYGYAIDATGRARNAMKHAGAGNKLSRVPLYPDHGSIQVTALARRYSCTWACIHIEMVKSSPCCTSSGEEVSPHRLHKVIFSMKNAIMITRGRAALQELFAASTSIQDFLSGSVV